MTTNMQRYMYEIYKDWKYFDCTDGITCVSNLYIHVYELSYSLNQKLNFTDLRTRCSQSSVIWLAITVQ
jgi:hypothetical protein